MADPPMDRADRPSLPARSILPLRAPADRRVAVAAIATAIVADLAWQAGFATVAGSLLIITAVTGLYATRRLANPQSVALAASAGMFGLWFALRGSPWLLVPDAIAIVGLLILATSLAGGGSVLDLGVPSWIARTFRSTIQIVAGAPYGVRAVRTLPKPWADSRRPRWNEIARGVLVALPLVTLLAGLLISADAVFASLLHVNVPELHPFRHAGAIGLGFVGMAGLIRAASATSPPPLARARPRLGRVEITIVLGSIVTLFGTFCVAQVIALSQGGRRAIETAGLTYAEYARSGFFQLVTVAAITLIAILSVRAVSDMTVPPTRRVYLILANAAIVLTLVIVFVALRRMDLYEHAYGLTMLRLYVRAFCLWISGVFVLTGLWLTGWAGTRHWLPSAAAALALAVLLSLNFLNPEAFVARHNVVHAQRTGVFDTTYAAGLSDDAVPTLVTALTRLAPPASGDLHTALCASQRDLPRGLSWNRSRSQAAAALNLLC
jgi:hypothetical protein